MPPADSAARRPTAWDLRPPAHHADLLVIQPVYGIAIAGDTSRDVVPKMIIAVAICVALVPAVVWTARRAEYELAITV